MRNFLKQLSSVNVMLLIVMFTSVMTCVSCSKDDEPKGDDTQTSNSLVGTWYYYDEYDEEIDYDDYFIFRSNGTGVFVVEDEEDKFTYDYDSKKNVIYFQYGDETEICYVEWLGNNGIELGDYGTYVRK